MYYLRDNLIAFSLGLVSLKNRLGGKGQKVLLVCWSHSRSLNSIAVVQLLSHLKLFVSPWTEALQASLPFTISQSLLKLMSIESVMPSNHLIPCCPLLLPSIFPSIKVFSNESAHHIRWLNPTGCQYKQVNPQGRKVVVLDVYVHQNRL